MDSNGGDAGQTAVMENSSPEKEIDKSSSASAVKEAKPNGNGEHAAEESADSKQHDSGKTSVPVKADDTSISKEPKAEGPTEKQPAVAGDKVSQVSIPETKSDKAAAPTSQEITQKSTNNVNDSLGVKSTAVNSCAAVKTKEPESQNEVKTETESKMSESNSSVAKSSLQSSDLNSKPVESKPVSVTDNKPSSDAAAPESTAKALGVNKAPAKAVPPVATVAPMVKATVSKNNSSGSTSSEAGSKRSSDSQKDGASPEKQAKLTPSGSAPSSKAAGNSSSTSGSGVSMVTPSSSKTPQQILEYMDKTFEHRRRIITKQMPTIPELQQMYPDLFMHKQLLTEFQRITKIDIDQKIQEFCVRFATAVIEMARSKKGAAPVIARWEKAQQENCTLKQYWDMMTALCLLPLHFNENFSHMVQEIGEEEEVVAQGKIEPILVARGNIFRTDEFFLIAENTIVQEFEEFTIALASLYSSYWVFNMVYPPSIENTYNYIQRCIVRQKEPGSVPVVCRNFTKALQKWNREKEGK